MRIVVISTAFASPTEELCRLSVKRQEIEAMHIYIDAAKQPVPLTHSENLYNATRKLDPEDVIVQLDGDDWLADRFVLSRLHEVYKNPDVWLTYGSFVISNGNRGGNCLPYKPTEDIRHSPWRCSHLKTFRAGLFQRLTREDLSGSDGAWTGLSVDRACMYPMVELAGWDRTRFIPDILYVYNYQNSYEHNATQAQITAAIAATDWFDSRPVKQRLERL